MSETPDSQKNPPKPKGPTKAEERLAQALRQNLLKRKAQQRSRVNDEPQEGTDT